MELVIGSVVKSKAGRDKGKFFTVVEKSEKYVCLCDGKERKLENPKKKNVCHIAVTSKILDKETMATNRKLQKALRPFNEGGLETNECKEGTACQNKI